MVGIHLRVPDIPQVHDNYVCRHWAGVIVADLVCRKGIRFPFQPETVPRRCEGHLNKVLNAMDQERPLPLPALYLGLAVAGLVTSLWWVNHPFRDRLFDLVVHMRKERWTLIVSFRMKGRR